MVYRVVRAKHVGQPWAAHLPVLHHLCQPQQESSKCLSCKGHRPAQGTNGNRLCWKESSVASWALATADSFHYWIVIFSQDPHRHRECTMNNLSHKEQTFSSGGFYWIALAPLHEPHWHFAWLPNSTWEAQNISWICCFMTHQANKDF